MVFFLNQKGMARGRIPPGEKERLYLYRVKRWSYTGTAWLRKGQCDGCLLGGSRKSVRRGEEVLLDKCFRNVRSRKTPAQMTKSHFFGSDYTPV